MKRIIFIKDNVLNVIRLGATSNAKIMSDAKQKIVQTYAFDLDQIHVALDKTKSLSDFFGSANSNCLDCPMRDYGKCYTHKFTQARGFLSMLRSIANEFGSIDRIPHLTDDLFNSIVEMCKDRYVRFGTYGEPILHGIELVRAMVNVSKIHTGYTHQWFKRPEFAPYFMASVHTSKGEQKARSLGYRSFVSTPQALSGLVNCPASKEGGFKSSCDKCGLCSGSQGKGKKSIYILEH